MDRETAAAILVLFDSDDEEESDTKRVWVSDMCAGREECGAMATTVPLLRFNCSPYDRKLGRFTNYFRLDIELFCELEQLVSPLISKQHTNMRQAISAKDRLALTIRYLASGHSMNDLHYDFKMG